MLIPSAAPTKKNQIIYAHAVHNGKPKKTTGGKTLRPIIFETWMGNPRESGVTGRVRHHPPDWRSNGQTYSNPTAQMNNRTTLLIVDI